MTAQQMSDEFKTSPLATKVIAGLISVIVALFGWWCVRVTHQLDVLIAANGKSEEVVKKVEEHSVYLQMLFDEQNKMKIESAKNSTATTGLLKDMDIVKAKLFK